MLNTVEKTALLELARKTLESYLRKGEPPSCTLVSDALNEKKGAFVSIHHGEDLRGCIGLLLPDYKITDVVQHCVVSAASEDMRFSPVTSEELPELKIEISVLSPFRQIEKIEEIEVGKHGLYMVRGHYRGLLLPQVATEYGWDRITFLKHTCGKSGLPENAWQDPKTQIYIFEAQVFSE